MRVLMLATSYPKYAGDTTAPFIAEIAAGVVRHGAQVRIVLPWHRDFVHDANEHGVELFTYRYAPHRSLAVWGYAESLHADVGLRRSALLAAPFGLTASFWALWRHIRDFKPDIIHAHWLLPNALPAVILARLYGIPCVVSMHGSDVAMAERNSVLRAIARWIFAGTALATACSGDLYTRALQLGAPPAHTHVLPYGVAVQQFAPELADRTWIQERFGIAPTAPLLVAVGRFVYKKGFHQLIEACVTLRQHHPDARLLLVGYGDLADDYRATAARLGVSDMIVMPGQLLRDEVARTIASADIYCVPSVHDESGNVDGLPNALLEGMAAGCAVVASRVAGIPDVITHEVHGLLCDEGDVTMLTTQLLTLIADPALRRRLGHHARQRIVHELTWDTTTAQLTAYYAKVLTP